MKKRKKPVDNGYLLHCFMFKKFEDFSASINLCFKMHYKFQKSNKNCDEKISSLTLRESNPQSCSHVHTPQSTEHFGTTGQK